MPMMAIMAKRPFATSAESFLVLNSMVDSVDSKFAQFAIKETFQPTSESPECRVLNGVAKANEAKAKVAFAVVALSR